VLIICLTSHVHANQPTPVTASDKANDGM
jgi:hypothetical protein